MNIPIETVEAFVRRSCGVCNNAVPVNIVDCHHKPILWGKMGGHFTRGGARIRSPTAYSRVGWSNMCYKCDSRVIYVGERWIDKRIVALLKG